MKKGFTLLELMIVVAIIGILAAIAVPRFKQLYICSKYGQTSAKCIDLKEKYKQAALDAAVVSGKVSVVIDQRANRQASDCTRVNENFVTCNGQVYKKVE